jgi:ABC-2 type transport system ATP-binding protein
MTDHDAVRTAGLAKTFGTLKAVDGVDLLIRRGEMFAIVGPDGAGKTTIVRMLCGILIPSSGSAVVLGHDTVRDIKQVKRKIGYLSQRFSLYGDLSIDENIEFFAEVHGVSGFRERREELLAFTRLTPFRDRLAERLSGGMKQKLALACTLIHTPELLVLDEPTTGVDPLSRRDFWVILHSLVAEGMTIVLTTPYLDEAERCSRVAMMNRGRILQTGTPQDLRSEMTGEVIELVCNPVRLASHVLRQAEEFLAVQTFGDRVNLIVREAAPGLKRAGEILKASGVEVTGIRPVKPSLENVFISLLTRQEALEVRS